MGTEKNQVIRYENVADQVLAKIKNLQSMDALSLPKNYAVDNALKAAWLKIQECEDRNHNKALAICTKESIANSLLDMVLQGLSVAKNQGYFIVYGNKLNFQRSYFGTIALAKRTGTVDGEPKAQVIYKDDEFVYTIENGVTKIIKHDQKLANIDPNKIIGAYAIVTKTDGEKEATIMTIDQIHRAWGQGATKGASPAHKNFSEEMAKKTVIGRACKAIINSTDDAWLLDGRPDEQDKPENELEERQEITAQVASKDFAEPVDFEDVEEPKPEPEQPQQDDDNPPY